MQLTAEDAERLGLVNFVVDDDVLLDTALGIAGRLATAPLEALIATKDNDCVVRNVVDRKTRVLRLDQECPLPHSAAAGEPGP